MSMTTTVTVKYNCNACGEALVTGDKYASVEIPTTMRNADHQPIQVHYHLGNDNECWESLSGSDLVSDLEDGVNYDNESVME